MKRTLVAVAAFALLAACGSDAEPKKTPAPTSDPAAPAIEGDPAPQALSNFSCGWAAETKWLARGVLSNSSDQPVNLQVTVYVGDAGSSGTGKTQRFDNIQAGGSVPFELAQVPGPDQTGTCNVQVLKVK